MCFLLETSKPSFENQLKKKIEIRVSNKKINADKKHSFVNRAQVFARGSPTREGKSSV